MHCLIVLYQGCDDEFLKLTDSNNFSLDKRENNVDKVSLNNTINADCYPQLFETIIFAHPYFLIGFISALVYPDQLKKK